MTWISGLQKPTSDIATETLAIKGQDAYVSASVANANGGDVNISAGLGTVTGSTGRLIVSASMMQVTGAVSFRNGLSGSHTRLDDGSSFLVAGSNVTITTASNGQVTISSTATGGGGGSSNGWIDGAGKMKTTGSISIDASSRYADAVGTDVFFFVSGSSALSSGVDRHVAVVGGDVVVSGSILNTPGDFTWKSNLGGTTKNVIQTTAGNDVYVGDQTNVVAARLWGNSSSGLAVAGNTDYALMQAGSGLVVYSGGGNVINANQTRVDITSTAISLARTATTPASDVFFFVSGSTGLSTVASGRKVTLLGGDTVSSGSLLVTGSSSNYIGIASTIIANQGTIRGDQTFSLWVRKSDNGSDLPIIRVISDSIYFSNAGSAGLSFDTGGNLGFNAATNCLIGAGTYAMLSAPNIYLAYAYSGKIAFDMSPTVNGMRFLDTVTQASLTYDTATSNVAAGKFLFSGQSAYASASPANERGGHLQFVPGARASVTASHGAFVVNDSTTLPTIPTDVFFYVSGSRALNSGADRHVAVIGGDAVVSGAVKIVGPTNLTTNAGLQITRTDGTGAFLVGAYSSGYGAMWFQDNATAPSAGNYAFLGDAANTFLNGPGAVYIGINNTLNFQLLATKVSLGTSYATPQYVFDLSTTAIQHFGTNATSAKIMYDAQTSNTLPATLTIQGQDAFSVASPANERGGHLQLVPGAAASTTASMGAVVINGSTTVPTIGTDVFMYVSGTNNLGTGIQGRKVTVLGSDVVVTGSVAITGSIGVSQNIQIDGYVLGPPGGYLTVGKYNIGGAPAYTDIEGYHIYIGLNGTNSVNVSSNDVLNVTTVGNVKINAPQTIISSPMQTAPSDVSFFVSGSAGSTSGPNRHVAAFGGDAIISGSVTLGGGVRWMNRTLTGSYVCDSISPDRTLFLSMSAASTITLPAPTQGREIVLKDISGSLGSFTCSVTGSGGTKWIENVTGSYSFVANFGVLRLENDGTNWWIVG